MVKTDKGYAFQGTFRAQALRVHDGDTATLIVDCGFRQLKIDQFRLYGINAPELHDPDPAIRAQADKARLRLTQLLVPPAPGPSKDILVSNVWPLKIETQEDPEKYGRWLVTIYVLNGTVEVNVNQALVLEGLAVPYNP